MGAVMIEIKQQSLMANPLGFAGALMAVSSGCSRAWWAGDQQYSILEMPYGLSIKIRKPAKSTTQFGIDIAEIAMQLMPGVPYQIEQDGDMVRVIGLKDKGQ